MMNSYLISFEATLGITLAIYFVGGILFSYGDQRIRWYAFSGVWMILSSSTLPFYAETCVLLVAFTLGELALSIYSPQFGGKKVENKQEEDLPQ